MSNFALACDFNRHERRAAAAFPKLTIVTVPWRTVSLDRAAMSRRDRGPRRWGPVVIVAALAISVHVGVAWYVRHQVAVRAAPVRKHEVEIQLVEPPKPPPPKIEPPRAPPPRTPVKRQQVLPRIQTAAPDTPAVDATPTDAPVAVAPDSTPLERTRV